MNNTNRSPEHAESMSIVTMQVMGLALLGVELLWENFPEIGQADWEDVEEAITIFGESLLPDHEEYEKAYDYLASRATDTED